LLREGVDQCFHLGNVYVEEAAFEPWLAATASVRFFNTSRNIDEETECALRFYLDESMGTSRWDEAEELDIDLDSCVSSAPDGSSFYPIPQSFSSLRSLKSYEKDFSNYLYQSRRLNLTRVRSLKMESKPGESEADFMVRVADRLREDKDEAVEKLVAKFQVKQDRLEKKLESAYAKLEKEKSDVSTRTTDTILSFGTAVLGAFLGRNKMSSSTMTRTASGIRKAGRIGKEKDDVRRAEESANRLEQELAELANEQSEALAELTESFDPATVQTEEFAIKPRRSDIFDVRVVLLWDMVPPRVG